MSRNDSHDDNEGSSSRSLTAHADAARATPMSPSAPKLARLAKSQQAIEQKAPPGTLTGGAYDPSRGRRRDIQALRALAVIAVFAYHVAPQLLPGGFVGVDVFFVVSGYLVGGALVIEAEATGRVVLRRFYARRVRRIAPLAIVVAIVTIASAAFTLSPVRLILWGSPADLPTVARDGIASVLGAANLWFGYADVG